MSCLRRALSGALLSGLLLAGLTATPAEAKPPKQPPPQHCSTSVVGQKPSGELILSEPVCADSQDKAQAAERDRNNERGVSASSVLAIHYKQANWTGDSLTVNGSNCNGGYVNMSGSNYWFHNATVSTRLVYCTRADHYQHYDLGGSREIHSYNEVNLSSGLVGDVDSISYLVQ